MSGTKKPALGTEGAEPGRAVPLEELFTTRYLFDAFALSYAIPEGMPPWRLKKDYLTGNPLRMVLLFVDQDHHDKTCPPDALERWKQGEMVKARILFEEHPGLAYLTNRGVRLVWRVDLPWLDYAHVSKQWYRELEERGFEGIDHGANSFARHMRLPRVRRDKIQQEPVIEGQLEFLNWTPSTATPAPRPTYRPRAPTTPSTDSEVPTDPLIASALARGLAVNLGGGKFGVFCPTEKHNDGALTDATAVWDGGGFKCFKATCRHVRYADWAAQFTVEVSADEVEAPVLEALQAGGIRRQASGFDITTGAGKSHVTRRYLVRGAIHEGIKNTMLTPTNALATQHRLAVGAHQVAGVGADIPGRDRCKNPNLVERLGAHGLGAKIACVHCSFREDFGDGKPCKVAGGVGDKDKGNVSTFSMLSRYSGEDETYNVVFDEAFSLVETVEVNVAEIAGAMASVQTGWRKEVEPWARGLEAGRVDPVAQALAFAADYNPDAVKMVPQDHSASFSHQVIDDNIGPVGIAAKLREMAHPSSKITFPKGKVRAVRLSEPAAYLKEHGGTILAAGLPEITLRALRPDLIYKRVNVQDSPGVRITRRLTRMARYASTTALLRDHDLRGELSALTLIVADITRTMALKGDALIVTSKALEPIVQALAPWAQIAHYGAVNGLDDWMGLSGFFTIGDHWANIGAVNEEAEFFGVDAWALSFQKIQTELEQAHGRARDPRRTTEAFHGHYGAIFPGRWHLGNTEVSEWADLAQFFTRTFDYLEAQWLKENGCSAGEVAKRLGVSPRTVHRLV